MAAPRDVAARTPIVATTRELLDANDDSMEAARRRNGRIRAAVVAWWC